MFHSADPRFVAARRESLRLAWPLILSNLTAPLLGLVDTAVVGRIEGAHHLGGVALAAAFVSALAWMFGFLRMATGGLTAQAHGAADPRALRLHLLRPIVLALTLGGALAAAASFEIAAASWFFAAPASIDDAMRAYLEVRLWGAPFLLTNHVLVGWLLGRQNPRGPLAMLLAQNGLNAILDVAFVFGLSMGVEGVALATVIAEAVGSMVGGWMALREWRRLDAVRLRAADWLEPASWLRYLVLARDLFLRTALMQAVFLTFARLGAGQGELALAANAVLFNFFYLQSNGLDGFADAAEAMCGKAVGRGRADELRVAIRAAFFNGALLAVALSMVFGLASPLVIDALTTDLEVRAEARRYLAWIALLPALSVAAFVFDGVYFGLTRPDVLRNAMLGALAVFLALAFVLPPALGNHGLWLAFLGFMVARGGFTALAFRRSGWGRRYLAGEAGAVRAG